MNGTATVDVLYREATNWGLLSSTTGLKPGEERAVATSPTDLDNAFAQFGQAIGIASSSTTTMAISAENSLFPYFSIVSSSSEALNNLVQIVKRHFGFFVGQRIKKLAKYTEGWDGEVARAARPQSASLLTGFIKSYKGFQTTPSFFLTREGYFAIAWEDDKNERIDIVFEEGGCDIESRNYSGRIYIRNSLDLQNLVRAIAE